MEALEQEVFKYKKMAEREVDIIHRINLELVTKYKKETTELWKDIVSLHETTNQLQAQCNIPRFYQILGKIFAFCFECID
jgi:hypothetical protein